MGSKIFSHFTVFFLYYFFPSSFPIVSKYKKIIFVYIIYIYIINFVNIFFFLVLFIISKHKKSFFLLFFPFPKLTTCIVVVTWNNLVKKQFCKRMCGTYVRILCYTELNDMQMHSAIAVVTIIFIHEKGNDMYIIFPNKL